MVIDDCEKLLKFISHLFYYNLFITLNSLRFELYMLFTLFSFDRRNMLH